MTLLVVGCSIAEFIEDDSTLGQIFKFLVGFLIMLSFVMGIKNLDGDTYHKILNEQKKGDLSEGENSFGSLGSSTAMYEEQDSTEEAHGLRQIKKK